MRIKLKKGKQRELILLSKKDFTWEEIAKKFKVNHHYLAYELKNEKRLLSSVLYKRLCNSSRVDFDRFIIRRLDDNWGKSKGGKNSIGSLIKLNKIKLNDSLAEFIGAVLGDGNINFYKKGKKIGVYQVRIIGDLNRDKDYHINYLKNLSKSIFNLEPKEVISANGRALVIYSKELIYFLISMGIFPGDKIRNKSTIPFWIRNNKKYLQSCLRGLLDTDGSIFRMSRRDSGLIRIGFKNHNMSLLRDTREAFITLGYNPSRIINNNQFFLSRQDQVKDYINKIGFSNKKHLERIKSFYSPIV